MFKVDEYLRRSKRARTNAKSARPELKDDYEHLAREWESLAMERLSLLKQMVHDKTLSWSECEQRGAITSNNKDSEECIEIFDVALTS